MTKTNFKGANYLINNLINKRRYEAGRLQGNLLLLGVAWITTFSTSLNYTKRDMTPLSNDKVLEYRRLYWDNRNGKTQVELAKEYKISKSEVQRRIDVYKNWIKRNT